MVSLEKYKLLKLKLNLAKRNDRFDQIERYVG
jgi:hypothetical protein